MSDRGREPARAAARDDGPGGPRPRIGLRQMVRIAKKLSSFAFFWGGGMAACWIVLPAVALGPREAEWRSRFARRVVRRGFVAFHDYMRALGLVDYDPRKTRLELPEGPFVLVANHPTLVDVTAIMAACGELACVVKQEHLDGFMVGRLLRLCGHIGAGDGTPLSSGSVVTQALDRLAAGQPVLVFPEGTRSPARGLRSFQRGAFEIARRARVPLVPLLVTCEPPALSKEERWYELPAERARMRIVPFEAFEPGELDGPSRRAAERLERRYRDHLEAYWAERSGARGPDRS